MQKLVWETPEEIDLALAKRVREIRNLFTDVPYLDIQEVINENK